MAAEGVELGGREAVLVPGAGEVGELVEERGDDERIDGRGDAVDDFDVARVANGHMHSRTRSA